MSQNKITISGLHEIDERAEEFLSLIGSSRTIAFYGEMGVGKTTFIKSLCKALKVTDEVTSPTFAIVNEYETQNDYKVYHFDFYRIKKEEEIFDFGYEEYADSDNYCLMEWPDKAENLLPDRTLRVNIVIDKKDNRILEFRSFT